MHPYIATRCRVAARLVAIAVAIGTSSAAQAQSWTEKGSITNLEAGWGADTLTIRHNAPFVNSSEPAPIPAGRRFCTVTNSGYATDPSDAGRALYHTVALAAFLNKKQVRLLLKGCVFDKPRIIAVSVDPA